MRLFIVGQKWLGAQLLHQCVASGHDIAGVAAPHPDDALFKAAMASGVRAELSPGRLTAEDVGPGVDLILAAHAHCYIAESARRCALMGALGYHPSLLPRHRGKDAIRWAIHMKESVTGGTLFWLDNGADTGDIALQKWCHIRPDDDATALWRRELAPMGLELFGEALSLAALGRLPRVAQRHDIATWEPGFSAGRLGGSK